MNMIADIPLLSFREVWKTYGQGEARVHALAGVDLDDRARRVRRHHGSIGLRQVDRHEHHRLPRYADQPAATAFSASMPASSTARAARSCATAISASSSRATICSPAPPRPKTSNCR
jgi:hypothetical protein